MPAAALLPRPHSTPSEAPRAASRAREVAEGSSAPRSEAAAVPGSNLAPAGHLPERGPAAVGKTKPRCASGLPGPLPTPRSSSPTRFGKLSLPPPFSAYRAPGCFSPGVPLPRTSLTFQTMPGKGRPLLPPQPGERRRAWRGGASAPAGLSGRGPENNAWRGAPVPELLLPAAPQPSSSLARSFARFSSSPPPRPGLCAAPPPAPLSQPPRYRSRPLLILGFGEGEDPGSPSAPGAAFPLPSLLLQRRAGKTANRFPRWVARLASPRGRGSPRP